MRRLLVLVSSVAVLGLMPVDPAYAEDVTIVVNGTHFPDTTYGLLVTKCSNPGVSPTGLLRTRIAYTNDEPPLGDRMLGWDTDSGSAIGPYSFTMTPSTVTTYSVRLNRHTGSATGKALVLYAPPGADGDFWLGHSPITSTGSGWTTIDASGVTFNWKHWDNSSQTFNTTAPDAILSTFVTEHGGDGTADDGGALLGFVFGCNGELFYLDDLRVGSLDNVTSYDFEEALTATSMSGSVGAITAGGSATLKGMPKELPSGFFPKATLTLEAKRFGSSEFVEVGTATATFDGTKHPATLVRQPLKLTTYRWVLPTSAARRGSTSPTFTVQVRTRVTSALADATLHKDQTLVLTGRTTPVKAGYVATLQRRVNGTWVDLKTGMTSSTGTYRLTRTVTSKGDWKVRVRIAGGGGNLTSFSPTRIAEVS